MKQKFSQLCSISKYWLLVVFVLAPAQIFADEPSFGIRYKLDNPLDFTSIEGILLALLQVFITIATPIIVISIIYAGFLYVTARGNVEQTKQATTALTYAIVGAVILLGSVAIAEIVRNLVEAFRAT